MSKKVIIGPPGTGKTTRLIEDVISYINTGTNIEKIAFLSFTNNAIDQARERIILAHPVADEDIIWFRTIHSMCWKLLGLKQDNMLTAEKLKSFFDNRGIEYKTRDDVRIEEVNFETLQDYNDSDGNVFLNILSSLKNNFGKNYLDFSDEELKELFWERRNKKSNNPKMNDADEVIQMIKDYEEWKKLSSLYDFNDMLMEVVKQNLFPDVNLLIVDEFQDVTKLQYDVIKVWDKWIPDKIFAGDDDQTIFSFSGSSAEFLIKESEEATTIVSLSLSHRLSENIKNYAERFASENILKRLTKNYLPKKEGGSIKEFEFAEHDWERLVDVVNDVPGSTTILFLTNYYKNTFGNFLIESGTPFRNYGIGIDVWEDVESFNVLCKVFMREGITHDEFLKLIEIIPSKGYVKRGLKKSLTEGKINRKIYKKDDLIDVGIHEQFFSLSFKETLNILNISTLVKNAWNARGCNPVLGITLSIRTIHNMKGAEDDNIIVYEAIPRKVKTQISEEIFKENVARLLYTGYTRAKERLIRIKIFRENFDYYFNYSLENTYG